ncbi:MAG TPA: ABC transporter permease [Candidatus Elarobacter sp.]|nr:ABC transporter permease [Candidatus Elarobacter sp.]
MPAFGPPRRLEIRRWTDLIRMTALRSLKVRYRGTILGVLWSFANPAMMTVVYTVIFGAAYSRYFGGSIERYVMSAFVGLVVVTFFLAATTEAMGSVVGNGGLLNKIAVPTAVFPLASVAANVFQQTVTTFPIVLVLSAVVTHDALHVVLVPVVLLALVALSTGFGLALAALYVFFRDLPHLWAIAGFVLWITSPLFYPAEIAPERIRAWFAINPVANALTALREVTIGTGPLDPAPVLAAVAGGAFALLTGALVFRALRRDFMDLL